MVYNPIGLASGYWQVEMGEADKEKMAFSTPFGLYQFKVMSFGLSNAPSSTFQRLMETVSADLHWILCLVYLDGIIIFSDTTEQYIFEQAERGTRTTPEGRSEVEAKQVSL